MPENQAVVPRDLLVHLPNPTIIISFAENKSIIKTMNKIIGRLLGIFLACFLIVSCNKNEEGDKDVITEQAFSGCFSSVSDYSTQTQSFFTGNGYQLRINYTRLTGDLLVSGLKLSSNIQYPDFTIKDIPFKAMNDGWFEFSGTNIRPEVPGYGDMPLFNSVKVRLLQREVAGAYVPALLVRFEIDGHYSVVSTFAEQVLSGTTVSTPVGGKAFTTTATSYILRFDAAQRRLKIVMAGSAFAANMPSLDIEMDNIPFSVVGDKAVFEVDALTPAIGGTPYPSFPITNLEGALQFGEGLDLSFNCAPAMVPGVLFEVEADCEYTDIAE